MEVIINHVDLREDAKWKQSFERKGENPRKGKHPRGRMLAACPLSQKLAKAGGNFYWAWAHYRVCQSESLCRSLRLSHGDGGMLLVPCSPCPSPVSTVSCWLWLSASHWCWPGLLLLILQVSWQLLNYVFCSHIFVASSSIHWALANVKSRVWHQRLERWWLSS